MLKNATFLPFYFADNQLFSNSETLVNFIKNNNISLDELHIKIDKRYFERLFNLLNSNLK
jgi:hypothetical protein